MTTLTLPSLFTPATAAEWNTAMLANADTLGLSTSAWQAGGVTRTTLAVVANVVQLEDVAVSLLNMGGFLDYAATGSVSYTDPEGTIVTVFVTPDPSIIAQNPTGEPGALDVLADSVYNVQRIWATYAGGQMAIVNTSAATYGPFTASTYHVAQPAAPGSPGYSNTASLSIPPSTIAGGVITGATYASPIVVTTSGAHGLTAGDVVVISGVVGNEAANGAFVVGTVGSATTFALTGSIGSGSRTSGGTVYVPTLATFQADSLGTPSNATTANVVTLPVTSLSGVTVANVAPFLGSDIEGNVAVVARCRLKLQSLSPNGPRGAYKFFALSSQQYATLLTPPLAVSSAITRALVQADKLTGTVVVTIANAAGPPTTGAGSDTEATDAVIQANCLPEGITAITQAAASHTMAASATVWVPPAYTAAIKPVAEVAIQVFFRVLEIGGVTNASGPTPNTNVVPYDALLGAIFAAARASNIPIQDASLVLDGGTSNVQLAISPVPEVAVLSPALPTVTARAVQS
jgi:hypothetical protein